MKLGNTFSDCTGLGLLSNNLTFLIFFNKKISQHLVPAYTVAQPDEAMHVLEQKASQLNVSNMILSFLW